MAVRNLISQEKTNFRTAIEALYEGNSQFTSPSWKSLRDTAWQRFHQLPLPTRRREEWKYTPIQSLYDQSFSFQSDDTTDVSVLLRQLPIDRNRALVFVNGVLSTAVPVLAGLQIQRFQDLLQRDLQCVQDLLRRHEILEDSDPFVALNLAVFQDGLLIEAEAGNAIQEPVSLVFINTDCAGAISLPLILARSQKESRLELHSYFVGQNTATHLQAPLFVLYADADSTLRHQLVHGASPETSTLQTTHVFQAKSSDFQQVAVTLDGQLVRQASKVHLLDKKTQTSLNGLSVLDHHSYSQDHIQLVHNVPDCESQQLYKGILSGHAIYDFDATIRIPKHAVKTNAQQLNRNLLLSDNARAYARPQLRIDADDVKCSHGCAIGEMSETELFYMRSRGIPESLAKTILTLGFADEVINTISNETLRSWLLESVHQRLESTLTQDEAG